MQATIVCGFTPNQGVRTFIHLS